MHKLVVILGTNASGKSALGIRLAEHFGGEVVSADSRQVYRGLNLGTGKITPEQAGTVRHHLIDVADVAERYVLTQYQAQAYAAIDGILAAGRRPFLVGGTGLYINAVVYGYVLVDAPPQAELRAELEQMSVPALVERLRQLDPDAIGRIDQNNPRRLVRAIEIAAAGHTHAATRQRHPRYEVLQLGLTWERDELDRRIEVRLADRLAQGMIEEVVTLRASGVSDTRLDELGLEYRYITRFLRGEIASQAELFQQLKIAIHQYARRQQTWFRRNPDVIWLNATGDYFAQARDLIAKWY